MNTAIALWVRLLMVMYIVTSTSLMLGAPPVGCTDCVSNRSIEDNSGAHTFIKSRAITTNNVFQHSLGLYWWYHNVLTEEDCLWWALQLLPVYQRSTGAESLATFFLPCQKSCISVKEDGTGDVGSLWLNLIAANDTSFDADISIHPVRSSAGVMFDFRFDTSALSCHSWLDVTFTVLHVKHDIHFCESPSSVLGTSCDIATVAQALNQKDWLYGKFPLCSESVRGVDTVQIKFGYDWFYCNTNHISPYFMGTVATGSAHAPTYIFEPNVNNKHGSIGAGCIGDYVLWEIDNKVLTMLIDVKYRYELPAYEYRSFDLCNNGDWSRYLQIVCKDAPSYSLPGINLCTQEVKVTPGSTVDAWLALHYEQNQWNVEVGYDFWWRQKETVELCYFPSNFGIYDVLGDCSINPVSASKAQICQSIINNIPASDSSFITIKKEDLNLNSSAMPRAISNSIYVAGAYTGEVKDHASFIGVGFSYECGHGNSALSNCAMWARMGVAF